MVTGTVVSVGTGASVVGVGSVGSDVSTGAAAQPVRKSSKSKMENRFMIVPRNARNGKAAHVRLADILAQLSKKVKNPPLESGG